MNNNKRQSTIDIKIQTDISMEVVKLVAEIFIIVVLMIPVYGILIWTYLYPRESLLWGRKSMYKEEPEFTEGAIRYAKLGSVIFMVVITIMLILYFIL